MRRSPEFMAVGAPSPFGGTDRATGLCPYLSLGIGTWSFNCMDCRLGCSALVELLYPHDAGSSARRPTYLCAQHGRHPGGASPPPSWPQ
jgi:hypothetical protein